MVGHPHGGRRGRGRGGHRRGGQAVATVGMPVTRGVPTGVRRVVEEAARAGAEAGAGAGAGAVGGSRIRGVHPLGRPGRPLGGADAVDGRTVAGAGAAAAGGAANLLARTTAALELGSIRHSEQLCE